MDWSLLVKECIANIGIRLEILVVVVLLNFSLYIFLGFGVCLMGGVWLWMMALVVWSPRGALQPHKH